MKQKTILTTLASLCLLPIFGQTLWTNYTNDRLINDVLVVGNNIWVGSQGGLTMTNRLTGEFETFLAGNSPIKGGGIDAIEMAPDNSLWMSSENAGIFHLRNGVWTQYYDGIFSSVYTEIKSLQVLANGDVWFLIDYHKSIAPDTLVRIRNGVPSLFGNVPKDQRSMAVVDEHLIYFSTGSTISEFNGELQQVTHVYNAENSIIGEGDNFYDIILDQNSTLIASTQDRILQLKAGDLTVLSTPGVTVNKAFKDGVGNVYLQPYLNEPNGIRLIKLTNAAVKYYKDVDFEPYPAAHEPLFRGADNQGKLFAVLFNVESEYTLYQFDENGWTPVKSQIFPMLDNYQDDVQADCDGNLWFGSREGVDVRYADGTWQNFTVETAPSQYFLVGHMAVDPVTCDVWFSNISNGGGPNTPGIIRISNGIVTKFLPGYDNVYDLEARGDGKVYFTCEDGFGFIENDAVHYIDHFQELEYVFNLASDSKGNLYLAEWGPALVRYDGTSFTRYGAGELGDLVYNVIVDDDDLVWVSCSAGIKLFDGVQFTDYSAIWPSSTLNDIVQDRKGNYWVSTYNDGLYYWDKQNLQHYDIFNSGLTTNKLRGVAMDPDGNLIITQWVGATVLTVPPFSTAYRGSGNVFFDYNQDGTFDAGNDITVPGQKIKDTDRDIWAVTNAFGKYAFYGDSPQAYSYRHTLDANATSTTPNPQSATFTDYQSVLPDFGFWKPNVPDMNVTLINDRPVCFKNFRVHAFLQNKTPYPISGDFDFHYTDLLHVAQTSIPPTQENTGQLVFQNVDIAPFGNMEIYIEFEAPGVTALNEQLLFEGTFTLPGSSFADITFDELLCSYDPNDKKVEPTGEYFEHYSLINDALKYTIRFQNEGNYPAFDITILDTLDKRLDPSTFELLASSHPVETNITAEGLVTFVFNNIDLPARSVDEDGSQGFVSFSIKPYADVVSGTQITNRASIYFDVNPPILTNTTMWNVVDDLTVVSTGEVKNDYSIYPNPTNGIISISIAREADYLLRDSAGRHITSGILHSGQNSLRLDVPAGVYFLQVREDAKHVSAEKIVVIR